MKHNTKTPQKKEYNLNNNPDLWLAKHPVKFWFDHFDPKRMIYCTAGGASHVATSHLAVLQPGIQAFYYTNCVTK